MSGIVLADAESQDDLKRYATILRTADADAGIRLVASGPVLAAYVCVVPGRGITGGGTVLGLRTFAVEPGEDVDVVVPAAAVLDRIAYGRAHHPDRYEIPVPPMSLFEPWAAQSPPRSGWEPAGEFDAEYLIREVRVGITELGEAGTGLAAQVGALRARVWGEPLTGSHAPRGLAFAAYRLRFLTPGEPARLFRSGPWWRLSTAAGHALAR